MDTVRRPTTGLPEDKTFVEMEANLERAGRVEELIRLYETRAKEAAAMSEAARLLSRAGELARERMRNFSRAEELFRRALVAQPSEREALDGLRALYEQRQDYAGLADVTEGQAARATNPNEAATLYVKAAELYENKLHRRERAVLCYQLAARAKPEEREPYRRIRALLMQENRYLAVYESLERERHISGGQHLGPEYAALAEKLVDDPAAHEWAGEILGLAETYGAEPSTLLKIRDAIRNAPANWKDRVRFLRAQSLEERDRKVAARTALNAARLIAAYDEKGQSKVKEALDRCFLLWPAMPEALTFIEKSAEASGDLQSAATWMEKLAADAKEKGAQVDLLLRLGTYRLVKLEDPEGASKAFAQAVALDVSRPDAVSLAFEDLVERGGVKDAVALLDKHVSTVKDKPTQVALRLRIADLCRTVLKDMDGARLQLTQVTRLDPNNASAAFQLAQIHVSDEDLASVEPLLDTALRAQRPVSERITFCEGLAMLYEERSDTKGAFEAMSRALLLDPSRADLLGTVVANARRAGAEEALVRVLQKAARIAEPAAAAELWRNAALVLENPLVRPDEAESAWQELLAVAPDDDEAKGALEALQNRPPPSPEARLADLQRKADALHGSSAEPQAAAALAREILELDPNDVRALERLSAAAVVLGQWEEVSTTYHRLIALSAGEERAQWQVKLGLIFIERLDRKDDAASLFLSLLESGQEPSASVQALERLAASGVRATEIARVLAPHYAKRGDHQRQVASLLVQLSNSKNREEQKELLRVLAFTHETQLADGRGAYSFWLRRLQLDPADDSSLTEAVRLARDLEIHVELTRSLVELARKSEDANIASALLQESAELAEEAGSKDDAIVSLSLAIERSPNEPELLTRLVRLYVSLGRVSEADSTLRRRIAVASPDEKQRLYLQLAEVNGELSRFSEAAKAYEAGIEAGLDELTTLPLLCDLHERAGRMTDLSRTLARYIEVAEWAGKPELVQTLTLRRAKVLDSGLGDKAAALRNYADILAARPSDPDALSALEGLMREPSCAEEAARALLHSYETVKDHRKLVTALDVIADNAKDTNERVRALRQGASVHLLHLRQPELAFASLAKAVQLVPSDTEVRKEAREAAEEADSLDAYVEVVEEVIQSIPNGPARIPLLWELADIFERKLDSRQQAVVHLRAVLELDPIHLESLRALLRLHRANDEWTQLADTLERLADIDPDGAEKRALWREAALINEQRLDDATGAAAAWRKIVEVDPLDREAASALDRLYTQLDDTESLVFALELRRAQEGQSPQGRDITFRLANLRRHAMNDPQAALVLLRQILVEDSSHPETRETLQAWAAQKTPEALSALELLDPVLAAGGEHNTRVTLREQRLAHAPATERAKLYSELRVILERDLAQPDRAFMMALQAFAQGVDRDGLKADLERLAKATDAQEELADIYEQAAHEEDNEGQKLALLRRGAELREALGQNEEAIVLWKGVLEIAPQDRQGLESLSKLYAKSQDAKRLSEVYSRQAHLAQEPSQKLDLLLKAARAYEDAGQDAEAIVALRSALGIEKSVDALVALDRLFEQNERFAEQSDVLAQLAEATSSREQRFTYVLRRGRILEEQGNHGEAVTAYSGVLQSASTDTAAIAGLERMLAVESVRGDVAKLLEPVFRSQNDHRKLVEVLDVRLASASAEKRLSLLAEIAVLRESLGQKALAFAARLRAFSEAPGNESVREELERVAADTGSFEELCGAYEDQLERDTEDEALTLLLWRRLAVLYGERLNRPDLAARAWEEVAKRDVRDADALDQLARIHRKTSAYRELANVMRRQIALESNERSQVIMLFELAGLAEEMLSDKSMAASAYSAILEREPEEPNAIKLLGRVLSETDRHAELAKLVEREIEIAERKESHEEAYALMVRLGRLKAGRLNDARGALAIYTAVLEKRAGHPGAVGALEEMAKSDSSLRGEAAVALEPIFASFGDHLKQVQMLEARASTEPVPQARVSLLRRIADVYAGPMGNAEAAFLAAANALREIPDDPDSLALCLKLAPAAGATEELAVLLGEIADKAADDRARAAIYRTLGRLQEREGEDDAALDSWRRVLEGAPSDEEALASLSRLLSDAGRTQELLEVLRRQLTMADDPSRRAALLLQIGVIQEEKLQDSANALQTFRKLLELTPNDPKALERMDALCQKAERWPELADVLARRLRLTAMETSSELRFRLALLRETKLLDKNGAIDLYIEVLQIQPNHAQALARMEGIAQREPQNLTVGDTLLQAYRESGDVVKLGHLLDSRVNTSQDSNERKNLLLELAQVRQDAQGEPELAFLALVRAFREDPNDAELRRRMDIVADAAHTHDELAACLEEELPRIGDPKDAAAVSVRLGSLYDLKLREPEQAVVHYEKARALDPDTAPKVLAPLDRIYNHLEQWPELVNVLEGLIALAKDSQEKIGYLFRLGQICQEKTNDLEKAAAAYELILEFDPKHLASARLLESVYEATEQPDKLFGILKHQRDMVTGLERERILQRMAQVSAEGLSDVSHSITLYQELLAKNPNNTDAANALEGLLERAKRYDELKDLLLAKVPQTMDPRELVRLNYRIGRVLHAMLGKPAEATPFFRAALERDPRHREALESLRDIHKELGQNDDLVVVLRRLLPLQDSSQGVKQVRIQLAQVLATMGRREEALDAARRALELDPFTSDELNAAYEIFFGMKAWTDAVKALELRVTVEAREDRKDKAIETCFAMADLWTQTANKPEAAGAALEKVLELDPANRQAYEMATQLYIKVNDWRAYAQVVDRYLPNLVTDEEKLAALRELVRVQEQKLGHKDVAFLAACRALQLDPAADGIRDEVERLAEETGSHEELVAVYEEVADELPKGPLAEKMYLTLAKVQDEKLDDLSGAETSLRKVLEFDPTNARALDALAGMFSRRGRHKDYIVALEQKLEAASSVEERQTIFREMARVYDEELQTPAEAIGALGRALQLEPDPKTLETLVAIHRREQQWAELAQALLRLRDIADGPEARGRLQVEIAQVYERDLNDDEAAIGGYRQALEFDPQSVEALTALERLYTKLDRPAELLAVYERQLEQSSDYREKVSVLFKSAGIWENKFNNLENADACVEGVLSLDPQNLQAIRALERLRREQGRWDELIHIVDMHIQLVQSPQEKAELCVELGTVFHQNLKQADRAVAAYHQALELDPGCRPAMNALGTLYERSGNWPFALEMIAREAEFLGATPDAVLLYQRIGKINEDMLLDPSAARSAYEQALQIDPTYLPAIRALKGIHEVEQDWGAYERALIHEAHETQDTEERAQAFLNVARFFSDKKEDVEGAQGYFEESLRLSPDSLEAAKPLADIYVSREDWPLAEQMMDIVVRRMTERAVAEQSEELARELCRQLYRLGYVAEKVDRSDKALLAYQKSYELDATYLPSLEGLSHLLVRAKRYEEALKVFQTILIHHREDLTDLEIVEIYWQLGDAHANLKQRDRAQNHFEKALGIDPGHEPSLRSLIALADEAGDSDKAVGYRNSLVRVLEDDDSKFLVFMELGRLAKERMNDAYMAIDAYVGAARLQPDSLEVLDSLYALYRATRQGQKAADVLERMLANPELETDTVRRKGVFYALGEVARDDLKDVDRSLAAFNAALDLDFRFVEAFSAVEQLLANTKRWSALEEAYARMIQRIPKSDDTHLARMTLWRALADLYLRVLRRPDEAFITYQAVATGLPDDASVQETFAELAAQRPGEEDKAIDAYRRAIPNTTEPGKIASALAELMARRKDYDGAYMAAQVVDQLIGQAGEGEREILSKLSAYAKKREVAQRALTDRLWQSHLLHPKVRGPLGEMFAILFEQAGQLFAQPLSAYGVHPKKHRVDVASAQEYHIHHYRYASRLLGMDNVELYSPFLVTKREQLTRRSNEPPPEPGLGVEVCHAHPAGLKVGGKFFAEPGQKEVYYLLGRALGQLRPEVALAWLPQERLEAVLQAALSLSVPGYRLTVDPNAVMYERRGLESKMSEPARAALARVTREYVRTAQPDDVRAYVEGAELTAVRAGLFVAGELEPVKKMVMGEQGATFRVSTRAKIRDLMVFALSEDLHVLREAVGTNVEVILKR